MIIVSLLGDVKQAALNRAITTIRVADERSNNRGRDPMLVHMRRWVLNGKLDAAGQSKLLGGKLGCGENLESTARCIGGGTTGRSSGGKDNGGGVDGSDGDVGDVSDVGDKLSLVPVTTKAGSLGMTSSSIRRCCG